MIVTIDKYGRKIVLEVADETDRLGQFEVRLSVGGKERYRVHFTDKSEDVRDG